MTEANVDVICDQFESVWKTGERPTIEDYLRRVPEQQRGGLLTELLQIELWWRRRESAAIDGTEYAVRFPDFSTEVIAAFESVSSKLPEMGDQSAAGSVNMTLPATEAPIKHVSTQPSSAGTAAGSVIGAYVIIDELGKGGMGEVFRARHQTMNREVALKVILPSLVMDQASKRRFAREVEAVARLSHPNIVTAFDAGESEGTHYLVMEYVVGSDFGSMVTLSGPRRIRDGVEYTRQAASGLAYAHEKGIVHRDIKPSNLMLGESNIVKIMDLGLARLESPDTSKLTQGLTNTGIVMGTVDFMAPEQALDPKSAGPQSDIYSLGCTLHFLLTGRVIYDGDTVLKRILAHREQPIPKLSQFIWRKEGFPQHALQQLDGIFERMVAKSTTERIASMHEVVNLLEGFLASSASGKSSLRLGGDSPAAIQAETIDKTNAAPEADTHNSALLDDTSKLGELPGDAVLVANNRTRTNEVGETGSEQNGIAAMRARLNSVGRSLLHDLTVTGSSGVKLLRRYPVAAILGSLSVVILFFAFSQLGTLAWLVVLVMLTFSPILFLFRE